MVKNWKIGKKLLCAIFLVSIIASISGAFGVFGIASVSKQYNEILNIYGFAQGDVGKLMASVAQADGELHDAVGLVNTKAREAAAQRYEQVYAEIDTYFSAVEKNLRNEEAKQYFADARQSWQTYSLSLIHI